MDSKTLPRSAPHTVWAKMEDVGALTSSLSEEKEIVDQNVKFRNCHGHSIITYVIKPKFNTTPITESYF